MEIEARSRKKYLIPIVVLSVVAILLSAVVAVGSTSLTRAQADLASTRVTLTQTQADLASVQANLTETQIDLTSARLSLTQSQADLLANQAELGLTKEQLSSLQTTYDNLQTNYDRLTVGYAYVLNDPTYEQMKSFIAADKTDIKIYDAATYNCQNFSADVITNAAKQNIRCGYVAVDFKNSGHALVIFNTTDRGVIYIESQSDEEVNLQVGKHYYQCVILKPGYYYSAPSYDDTVVRFIVIW
jgi:hypothetical protein